MPEAHGPRGAGGSHQGPVVAVVQARTGSSRLPGKVLEPIAGLPLVEWTIRATCAIPGIDAVVLATTRDPGDDPLADLAAGLVAVHRGSTYDVLTRCWEAVAPYRPFVVVRQTADNPFPDPDVVAAQVARLVDGAFDFVGNTGWPLGMAAEVARAAALGTAAREAVDPAEREHVMPFLYARPARFRIGRLVPPPEVTDGRFTVDTRDDLTFVRALAERVGHGPPIRQAELARVLRDDPDLGAINAGVRQKAWREVDERATGI